NCRTFRRSMHWNPEVLSLVRRVAPEVAILTGSYAMPTVQLAALALRAQGIPWMYWGEEIRFDRCFAGSSLLRYPLRWLIRRADGVLAIGAKAGDSYARAGVRRERIANFHYYPDADNFR